MLPTSMMMLTLLQLSHNKPVLSNEKGQEIAPIKVNMVRRDIDLAYYAYFPTAPETIQLMVKHISYNQLMIKKLSHTKFVFQIL